MNVYLFSIKFMKNDLKTIQFDPIKNTGNVPVSLSP